ncbi:MAG: hypothetical protein A3E87_08510 [Gammaproteobacteria bacterium RIFCSPHIGHO2_12_FULL_35_23]|nr:MAG: hypothetical protein A3E87_08510 [Gammaproteobacteria bacterium RIFCSPHIGHO2_12_FULL_35_23]
MKKIALTILSLLLAGTALASPNKLQVSDVNLASNVTIKPAGNLLLDLTKLVPGIIYDITCNIQDPNYAVNQAILGIVYQTPSNNPPSLRAIYLNNTLITGQAKLNAQSPTNILVMQGVQNSSYSLNLANADQQDSIIVSSCDAVAES